MKRLCTRFGTFLTRSKHPCIVLGSFAIPMPQPSRLRHRQVKDMHTWRQRLLNIDIRWQEVLPHLTDTYLQWLARHANPLLQADPLEYDFEIDALDLNSLELNQLIHRRGLPAVDVLILEGYLGVMLEKPTISVSLTTLELYCTLQLVKPSLSVEGFTKFLCYKYCVSLTESVRKGEGANVSEIYRFLIDAASKEL